MWITNVYHHAWPSNRSFSKPLSKIMKVRSSWSKDARKEIVSCSVEVVLGSADVSDEQ
jgi:hypothetical protein